MLLTAAVAVAVYYRNKPVKVYAQNSTATESPAAVSNVAANADTNSSSTGHGVPIPNGGAIPAGTNGTNGAVISNSGTNQPGPAQGTNAIAAAGTNDQHARDTKRSFVCDATGNDSN